MLPSGTASERSFTTFCILRKDQDKFFVSIARFIDALNIQKDSMNFRICDGRRRLVTNLLA
jgi:chlorite dismutase